MENENTEVCLYVYHKSTYEQIDPSYYIPYCDQNFTIPTCIFMNYCGNCGRKIEVEELTDVIYQFTVQNVEEK